MAQSDTCTMWMYLTYGLDFSHTEPAYWGGTRVHSIYFCVSHMDTQVRSHTENMGKCDTDRKGPCWLGVKCYRTLTSWRQITLEEKDVMSKEMDMAIIKMWMLW
jgi:hypothetical protein